jgi:2-haloacid dehalogenase
VPNEAWKSHVQENCPVSHGLTDNRDADVSAGDDSLNQIDTVVFDLGDVLIPWNPRNLYRKLFKDEESMERFLAEVCTPAWNLEQDRGRSIAEGTAILIAAFPGQEAMIRAFYERWTEMLGGVIEGSLALLLDLKRAGYRVLALTNWSAETFPIARLRYPFLEEFEGIVVSGVEGLIKPDPAIFQLLCERYGLVPQQAVFIDDNAPNLVGAKTVGMNCIHFNSPARVKEELALLGVRL